VKGGFTFSTVSFAMKRQLNISGFAEITRRVIARDGFDGYLPTLCLPERKNIKVLEGIPESNFDEMRAIALEWADEAANHDEEYFLAYKEDSERFRVLHRDAEGTEEESFLAHPNTNNGIGEQMAGGDSASQNATA